MKFMKTQASESRPKHHLFSRAPFSFNFDCYKRRETIKQRSKTTKSI